MQIFSMSRQAPIAKDGKQGQSDAQWYNDLKAAMGRSLDSFEEQTSQYSVKEIAELREAYNYLFEGTENLTSIIDKVSEERADLVEMVDFVALQHARAESHFAEYVARFLGKELALEKNYTSFDVRTKKGADPDALINKMREGLMKDMTSSALSSTKKVAGASYRRNPHSLSGERNLIGLEFLAINERTLRENTILRTTLGSIISLQEVFDSKAMERLIPSNRKRSTLKKFILGEVHQDSASSASFLNRTFIVAGVKLRNPLKAVQDAVVVKLFGSIFVQTLKQSTVLVDAIAQFSNTTQAVPFLAKTLTNMVRYSLANFGSQGLSTDSKKVFMDTGQYALLENSPVFNRDYEKGNIDPYTGNIETNLSSMERLRRKTKDWSLLNLKSTDKIVAVASWLTYYGDYLISNGSVDSFSEINWENEAKQPSREALAHADGMVTKDQSASTARQAAAMYKSSDGIGGQFFNWYRATALVFARFAISKKRAINSDLRRLVLARSFKARLEAGRALAGSWVSLSTFNSVTQTLPVLFQGIAAALGFEDEEEYDVNLRKRMWNVFANTFRDMMPIPPIKLLEDSTLRVFDAFLYWSSTWESGDPSYVEGESFLEGYERWVKSGEGVTIYGERDMSVPKEIMHTALGPYGDYMIEVSNTIQNLSTPGEKIITLSGKERYIRPEDKATMDMFFMMKLGLLIGELTGFGVKEFSYLNKTIDDGPLGRALGSEEELFMYMTLAQELAGSDPYFLKALEDIDTNEGMTRFMKHIMETEGMTEFDALRAVRRFGGSGKPIVAESTLRTVFGVSDYNKHIRVIKQIQRSTTSAKDYAILMNRKKDQLSAAAYEKLQKMTNLYVAILSPGKFSEAEYYNIMEEE